MFVRFLNREQIQTCLDMLAEFHPRIDHVDGEYLKVFAPDGDVVMDVIYTQHARHIVRLHPEVFVKD